MLTAVVLLLGVKALALFAVVRETSGARQERWNPEMPGRGEIPNALGRAAGRDKQPAAQLPAGTR